jgi:molybdopterin molybdotransferase
VPTIAFEEALAAALGAGRWSGSETVPLAAALGRVASRDVAADTDLPPWDVSAMDGFACRAADRGGPLRVRGTIAAGDASSAVIAPGDSVRIMTGARLPPGVDFVIKREDTEEREGTVHVVAPSTASNVRRRGEDVKQGEIVVPAGTRLEPAVIGMLAAVGQHEVAVASRPTVAVLATGSELAEPGQPLGPAQIRNSNAWQTVAQLAAIGCAVTYRGVVRDEMDALVTAIQAARAHGRVLVLSGGVSVGDFDLVPEALRRCGYQLVFEKVAMQPGKPTVFARDRDGWCWGLPGNPVSAFVACELLVKPFLRVAMGEAWQPRVVRAQLAQAMSRRKAERQAAFPVAFDAEGRVHPVEYHGSAHILAMARAHALVVMPAGTARLEVDALVDCRLL